MLDFIEKYLKEIENFFRSQKVRRFLQNAEAEAYYLLEKGTNAFTKALWAWLLTCIGLHVAAYFWPELPDKIPALFGLYDQLIQVIEFIIWTGLKGLDALLKGEINGFRSEWTSRFWEGLRAFREWIGTL